MFLRRIEPYLACILARCRWPLGTNPVEGINSKIKVIKHEAYGYRDDACFLLHIRAAFPGHGQRTFFLSASRAERPAGEGNAAHGESPGWMHVAHFSPQCGNAPPHALNISPTDARRAPAGVGRGAAPIIRARQEASKKRLKNRFHAPMRERAGARAPRRETAPINRGVAYVFTGVFLLHSRLQARL